MTSKLMNQNSLTQFPVNLNENGYQKLESQLKLRGFQCWNASIHCVSLARKDLNREEKKKLEIKRVLVN